MSYQRIHAYIWGVVLLVSVVTPPSLQCGPGRGAGRRRGNRKMTPLVFKQHVPNVSENTLVASGLPDGKISRDSPEFKDLVRNINPEIVFKDEEGTGADRLMSQRCKDKLTTLAISVMNQWEGVRLRVTEAWDEDDHHASDSLHYEGRAVDITTSDRDKSKYGTLARLAYEAGFDWVYYESRGHIHCSVKSDNSIASKTGGCFPNSGHVMLEDGTSKSMDQLTVGDSVLATDTDGNLVFSEVIMFFHRGLNQTSRYYDIQLDSSEVLSITGSHLVYVAKSEDTLYENAEAVYAGKVEVGMYMFTHSATGLRRQRVVQVEGATHNGIHAPLTKHGTIIVDNVAVSCYAWIENHMVAHAALYPVRAYYELSRLVFGKPDSSAAHENGGVHWYAGLLHTLAPYVVPEHLLFSAL